MNNKKTLNAYIDLLCREGLADQVAVLNEANMTADVEYDKISDKAFLYMIFIFGFICMWLVPSLAEFASAHNGWMIDIF